MDEQALNIALQDLALPKIHYFAETDSTNDRALALISQGTPEFTLVIAERQSAGRGRFGRQWETSAGASLAFTLILHPTKEEQDCLGLFSLLGALATCLAIEHLSDIKPMVKWPNDILLGGKKTAGILAEASWRGISLDGLALGIGINLLEGSAPPDDKVMFPATCVTAHCTSPINRLSFLASVLKELLFLRSKTLTREFIDEYRSRLAFIGQQVQLIPVEGKSVEGKLVGIQETGELIIMAIDGSCHAFPIGDLKLRAAA